MDKYRSRAEKGAAVLDGPRPGWYRRVNIEALDLNDCFECVVGQVFGHYTDGREALGIDGIRARELGFDFREIFDDPEELSRAWRELIRERLENDNPVIDGQLPD
jgi:hypothetical protein